MCSHKAACVGGMASIALPLFVKSSFHASLISVNLLERLYIWIINLSIRGWHLSTVSAVGVMLNSLNAIVTSGYLSHVSHVVTLPLPVNEDVWSHPVRAWNTGSPLALSGPRIVTSSWIGMYRHDLPIPNDIHISSMARSLKMAVDIIQPHQCPQFATWFFCDRVVHNLLRVITALCQPLHVYRETGHQDFWVCCTTPGCPWLTKPLCLHSSQLQTAVQDIWKVLLCCGRFSRRHPNFREDGCLDQHWCLSLSWFRRWPLNSMASTDPTQYPVLWHVEVGM